MTTARNEYDERATGATWPIVGQTWKPGLRDDILSRINSGDRSSKLIYRGTQLALIHLEPDVLDGAPHGKGHAADVG